MMLDLDLMRKVHETSIQSIALDVIGEDGQELASRLAASLPLIHAALDVDLLPDGLFVFAASEEVAQSNLTNYSAVIPDLLSLDPYPRSAFTVEVLKSGYRVRPSATNPRDFPEKSIGYSFTHGGGEQWHVGTRSCDVFNPSPDRSSVFAALVFSELKTALGDYARRQVQNCRCPILAEGWLDEDRIFWRQRPEIQIRRSLESFLVSRLRAVVQVEHIVDEDKEVDVVVFWKTPLRGALIECKWLGVSASEPDQAGVRKISRFTPAYARSGFAQLADYLDRKRARADGYTFKGYLVVVDGRRWGASDPDAGKSFTNDELMKFEFAGVQDWPTELIQRTDLAEPDVMFCRPKL